MSTFTLKFAKFTHEHSTWMPLDFLQVRTPAYPSLEARTLVSRFA